MVYTIEVRGLDAVKARLEAASEKLRETAIRRGLLHVAARIVETVIESIGTPFPPPSEPGEPPHVRTGALRRSVRIEREEPGAVYIAVGGTGTGVPYAAALEFGTSRMEPRPFVSPVIEIAHLEAEQIMTDEINKQLGDVVR